MKYASRILCFILAAFMLLSAAACADTGDSEITTADPAKTEGSDVTESLYDENGYIKDDLDPTLNFGNEKFSILAWEHSLPEFEIEDETGNMIESAIFKRNANTESRLGVELEFTIIKGNSSAFRDFCQTVENSITVNDTVYDAIGCYLRSAGVMTSKHHLVDLLEVEHLDFTKPWWSDSLLELNTINDKLFFISGDIASTLIYQMMFMIYNDDLGTDKGLTNPQQIALDGKWTLDLLLEMAKDVYVDLDADDKKSEGDTFGLFSFSHPTSISSTWARIFTMLSRMPTASSFSPVIP